MERPVPFFLGEGSTTKSLTKAETRRIAANIAKLPGLTQQLLALSRSGNREIDAYRPADGSAAAAPAAFLPRESD
jgi:hypothetical protein